MSVWGRWVKASASGASLGVVLAWPEVVATGGWGMPMIFLLPLVSTPLTQWLWLRRDFTHFSWLWIPVSIFSSVLAFLCLGLTEEVEGYPILAFLAGLGAAGFLLGAVQRLALTRVFSVSQQQMNLIKPGWLTATMGGFMLGGVVAKTLLLKEWEDVFYWIQISLLPIIVAVSIAVPQGYILRRLFNAKSNDPSANV